MTTFSIILVINARHACAARVTVVAVCLSVCYNVFSHDAEFQPQQGIPKIQHDVGTIFKKAIFLTFCSKVMA